MTQLSGFPTRWIPDEAFQLVKSVDGTAVESQAWQPQQLHRVALRLGNTAESQTLYLADTISETT